MKTITIIKAEGIETQTCLLDGSKQDFIITGPEDMSVSDGYHTFDELYDHRITNFIALCKAHFQMDIISNFLKVENPVMYNIWRSKLHSDGSSFDGWFILGIRKEKGQQITYHLPMSRWEETNLFETLEKAPEWDGHTSQDVLERLKKL